MFLWLPTWITVMRFYMDYTVPKVLLNRPQLVQNRAARIVTFTKKCEHITPSLIDYIGCLLNTALFIKFYC